MTERQEKMSNLIREQAALFIGEQNNKTSLITVTRADISPDFKNATVFITVLPESSEAAALDFCKRKRRDLKHHLKKHLNTRIIPFVDVELDYGEKNRQRIDSLIREQDPDTGEE